MGNACQSIFLAARDYQLNPHLIASVVHCESGGEQAAVRYEPAFYKKYLKGKEYSTLPGLRPKGVSETTEVFFRSCSLGLMQVMGETARENGYQKTWLSDLLVHPEDAVMIGAKILRKFLEEEKFDTHAALLRYNGGGDADYPLRVLNIMETGKFQYLLNEFR